MFLVFCPYAFGIHLPTVCWRLWLSAGELSYWPQRHTVCRANQKTRELMSSERPATGDRWGAVENASFFSSFSWNDGAIFYTSCLSSPVGPSSSCPSSDNRLNNALFLACLPFPISLLIPPTHVFPDSPLKTTSWTWIKSASGEIQTKADTLHQHSKNNKYNFFSSY